MPEIPSPVFFKDHKILCTLGPASVNPRVIGRLEEMGVSLFRINLSHTGLEKIEEFIQIIRTHSDVPICLDTQGAQIRTGVLQQGKVLLEANTCVELTSAPAVGNNTQIPLYPDFVLPQLRVGDVISVDFNTVLLQVIEVSPICRVRVLNGGTIGSNKAVSMDRPISLLPLTSYDHQAIQLGKRLRVKHFAMSFANCSDDIEYLRWLVGKNTEIIAKIESRQALENLSAILAVANAILIDRGDLSREIPIERLPLIQKEIIHRANEVHVPVYVATNLLESMVTSSRPTRAEVNDVINTLMDGADGLVLAAETAIGAHPVECVSMISSLIRQFQTANELPTSFLTPSSSSRLVEPHGGKLVDRVMRGEDDHFLAKLPAIEVDACVLMDIRQIATGTYSPLDGFMNKETLESVLERYHLPDDTPWPMPILLQLPTAALGNCALGDQVVLAHGGKSRAVLHVEESFTYDLRVLAERWYGTSDTRHPGVARLFGGSNRFISGKIDLLLSDLYHRHPYELTPSQARSIFEFRQWEKIIGFHTRNVAHRAHEYLLTTALDDHRCDGILIHPIIGPRKNGDFSADVVIRSYELLIKNYYSQERTMLAGYVNYSRYAGPREALFTALCRKNFGCSHFIVGRDHAGIEGFYTPEDYRRVFDKADDLGIEVIFFGEVYFCKICGVHVEHCQHGQEVRGRISGTQARETLRQGQMLPEWYMRETISALILEEIRNGSQVFVES